MACLPATYLALTFLYCLFFSSPFCWIFFFLSSVSFSGFLRLLYLYLFSSALPWRWLQSAAPLEFTALLSDLFSSALPWRWLQSAAPLEFTALLSDSPSSPHSSCGPGLSPSSYFFLRFPVFRIALNQL